MKISDIKNSALLIKRFCKDYELPINVYQEPYFSERLNVLDTIFDCKKAFDGYCKSVFDFNSDMEYINYRAEVNKEFINIIKYSDETIRFMDEMRIYSIAHKYFKKMKGNSIYEDDSNSGKVFVSIVMPNCKFAALHHYSKDFFGGCSTWKEFVSRFLDDKYIANNNLIGEHILKKSGCNRVLKHYLQSLMSDLVKYIVIRMPSVNVKNISTNEIIIEPGANCGWPLNTLKEVIDSEPNGLGNLMDVYVYELVKIREGWIKVYYNNYNKPIEINCIDPERYHIVVKDWFDIPVTDNDMVFYHKGHLAKYIN